jgi:hypothetical protein
MAIILGTVIRSTSMGKANGSVFIMENDPYAWFGRARRAFDVLKELQGSITFA